MIKGTRILFLDVFRGITIFAMLMVNNPGSWGHIYSPFKHAKWHGFGGADWIFPFFLFITGFAIPLSIGKYIRTGNSKVSAILKITKRSLLLFLLGIILNGFPDFNWNIIRIPGVLQRIAVVYFFSAIIFIFSNRKIIVSFFIIFLLIHWAILTQIPIPGQESNSLEMGKNISGWIDSYLLPNHLWIHTKTWDPEGFLGTIPSISSCLFGVYVGIIFFEKKKFTTYQSFFGILVGVLLISFSLTLGLYFPINKSLWTGTFVLLSSGLAIVLLHLLYYWIDTSKKQYWYEGFEYFGVNALSAFFLSSLFSRILNMPIIHSSSNKLIGLKTFLYNSYFINHFTPYNASILWAIVYTFFWLFIFRILYKKRIIIKL